MKTKLFFILLRLAACVAVLTAAHGQQYFRISGPAKTWITGFRPDGSVVWTNPVANRDYEVQVTTNLANPVWTNYVQLLVTNHWNTNQIVDFNPPAGTAFIPAGVFVMGDTLDNEGDATPVTNVYVAAFYMETNLVSYGVWQSAYNWATNHGYKFDNAGAGEGTNYPVQTVDWYDVVKWCNARSQQAGLAPVYYTDIGLTQIYTNGDVSPYANWSTNGYRLPTEAEWEKAARSGLSGLRFPWGYIISESQANYNSLPGYEGGDWYDDGPEGYNTNFAKGKMPYTSPVGYFPPNRYGLFDTTGNVYEWCWDWYGTPYTGGSNPQGPATGSVRVCRGGSWYYYGSDCRLGERYNESPAFDINYLGFRVVQSQ